MFDFLYETKDQAQIFGDNFCGPVKLTHGKDILVAKYDDDPKSDGYGVEVFCNSMPADFFKVVAMPSKDSVGELKDGFVVSFGSGCCKQAQMIAELINEGMIGFKQNNAPQSKAEASEQQATPKVLNP